MLSIEQRVVGAGATAEERRGLVEEISLLKRKAFDELIHEDLSADESFTIFMRLVDRNLDALQWTPPGEERGGSPAATRRAPRAAEPCRPAACHPG